MLVRIRAEFWQTSPKLNIPEQWPKQLIRNDSSFKSSSAVAYLLSPCSKALCHAILLVGSRGQILIANKYSRYMSRYHGQLRL